MARIDVVLPVLNEERVLERSVRALHAFLTDNVHHEWKIVVADNGSTDRTFEIAQQLETALPGVNAMHIPERGRGRALSLSWLASDADVVSYMDIDLSTDLASFPPLVNAILIDGNDVAVGSRLSRGSDTTRSLKREVLSRGYLLITNLSFRVGLRDTQCGFKAASRQAAQRLLPLVKDTGWFWDTELLLLAAKGGWRIATIPVRWVEDTDSRVKIFSTASKDIAGLIRMLRFDWSLVRKQSG
jgi:glycosyltransferase involved in cell wall biosynthesis